jgi:hypothetical protein
VSSLSGSPHTASSTPSKSTAEARPIREEPEPSKPVDVPADPSASRSHHGTYGSRTESHLVHNSSISDMYLRGPPRLPLPIEEEVHTPGSPILGPDDGTLQEVEPSDEGFTRKSSGVSAGTVDDDDNQELRVDKKSSLVATKIEWKRGGDKVYVTGTIFHWSRKHRLQPVEGKPGCFAAEIHIMPGTHHLRFLVDGVMTTSHDLPTTVDFGNNLVNYIEVSPDDVQRKRQSQTSVAKTGSDGLASQSMEQLAKAPKGRAVGPVDQYKSQIPQYLIDFDQAEDSPAYNKAVAAIEKLPTPPTLPGFLAKPILNAAVLMKDDNSVLNMPNHTVLNHLATSSIKNNVLAVSATTRYRNKVCDDHPLHHTSSPWVRLTLATSVVCDNHHVQAKHSGLEVRTPVGKVPARGIAYRRSLLALMRRT